MALRDKISIKKKVVLSLTADDWQLYTTSMNCKRPTIALNDTFEYWFNIGASREELMKYMYDVMNSWREYGTADSEPMHVLEKLADMVYA